MFKIPRFFLLATLITLSLCQNDEQNMCSEDNPEYCFGAVPMEDDQVARSNEFDYNSLKVDLKEVNLPKNFDARERWPQCKDVIGRIKFQDGCGNCWSYATTMAFADRVCIANNGTNDAKALDFSIKDVCLCCERCLSVKTTSCSGGYVPWAFVHFVQNGAVLEECKKFNMDVLKREIRCDKKCDEKNKKIDEFTHKGEKVFVYAKPGELDQIKYEIMTNGPVCATSYIHKKFLPWKGGGVFKDPGEEINNAGHALRVIGWGHEEDVDYWLIANSWGTGWGDKGFAKVDMTNNIMKINSFFSGIYTKPMSKPVGSRASTSTSPAEFLIFTIIVFVFWHAE